MEAVAISENCRSLLEENRHALNARYLQRKAQGAKIDAQLWLQHVQQRILPLVDAVYESERQRDSAQVNSEIQSRCYQTLIQLYEVSLDLFSAGHFAETTGLLPEALAALWDKALPDLASILAKNPKQVAGKLSNGVLSIAKSQSGSVQVWLDCLKRIAGKLNSVDELLRAGEVAAWVAGLPEYRTAALEIAKQLPAQIMAGIFNLPGDLSEIALSKLLQSWRENPWQSLDSGQEATGVRLVARCGAFQGYGGVFLFPPTVFEQDRHIFASDGKSVWMLLADGFGQTFCRSELSSVASKYRAAKGSPAIDKSGNITWDDHCVAVPELEGWSSAAFDGQTLAVTVPTSFHIYLITNFDSTSSPK